MPQRTREEKTAYMREYRKTERGHEIIRVADAKHFAAHHNEIREYRNLKQYGLTKEEYWKLWDSQDGKCAGCGKENYGRPINLCVDHDHVTGRVRGLLCSNCNSALGLVQDKPEILAKLIDYLIPR